VLSVDELDDDDLIVPVAMMGAPTVMLEKLPRGDEANAALDALQKVIGKNARAVFCIEAGGLNSTIPVGVAATAGLPIVDGDGMGRAFPELQMVSMSLHASVMSLPVSGCLRAALWTLIAEPKVVLPGVAVQFRALAQMQAAH